MGGVVIDRLGGWVEIHRQAAVRPSRRMNTKKQMQAGRNWITEKQR